MLDHEFKLAPSKRYLILLSFTVLTSLLLIGYLPIESVYKCVGWFVVGSYGAYQFWMHGLLRHPHSIISIRRLSDGKWLLRTNKNKSEAERYGDSMVTGWFSLLRFKVAARYFPRSCLIFCDSLTRDDYRKLVVMLKMY